MCFRHAVGNTKHHLTWRAFTIAKLLKSNDRAYSDKSLLVIGADGEQLGVMKLAAACQAAQNARLDLVLVSENSNPPVCRIMDFGKLLYEQKKKIGRASCRERVLPTV